MGTCLARCGVDTSKIPGVTHCGYHKKPQGHVIRAEELANGLNRYTLVGIQKRQLIDPNEFEKVLVGMTGIIFFKDYWQTEINGKKEEFRNRSGDHIDLWNGSRLTDWTSWVRIHIRIGHFGLHSFVNGLSDLRQSKSIWFWRIL
ncbi:MAG: hypothetical protein HC877_19545 [Thioploca sp.]|nr:hypothetical protein [Thioploca sp.]